MQEIVHLFQVAQFRHWTAQLPISDAEDVRHDNLPSSSQWLFCSNLTELGWVLLDTKYKQERFYWVLN